MSPNIITKSYYGPFFWVALVSFLVPLSVAARAFHEVQRTSSPTPHPDASGVDHALWDYLLKTYVENGLVDYRGMARDHVFRLYLSQLAGAEPHKLTTYADELALYCNAYNAYVINGVIAHKIQDSVMNYRVGDKEFFDLQEHIFAGRTMSLNYLEHELIRKRFHEPRIHVALVCAAKSCPSIRAEAFVGRRLASQLEDQSIQFANNPKYVAHDPASNTMKLSPILKWYGEDWQHLGGYLPWLVERIQSPALKEAVERASRGELQVAFFDYDWSLNSQAPGAVTTDHASQKKAEFGSGSVPNQ